MSSYNSNLRDSSQSDVHGIPRFHDSQQSCVRETPRFHDYNIRIWNDEDGNLVGTYINADFNDSDSEPYHGIFYHMSDDHLSIELGTHDEFLISTAVFLCKSISEKMILLDNLLTELNNENNNTSNDNNGCFRNLC